MSSPMATRWRRSKVVGDANGKRGTEVTFLPRPKPSPMTEFDFATLEHRLRELAFLNSGVNIVLSDMRHAVEKREEMRYEGGVEEFVKYLDRNKKPLVPAPIMIKGRARRHRRRSALWWNDSYHENVLCFTNNIPQRDGGTHLAGFRGALTRQVTAMPKPSPRREGRADRRRLPRGPDRGAVGQGAGPEILLADQGQAGLLRSAPGGRERLSTRRSAPGSRSIRPKPRSSSARWSRPPPRARPRARRAS
jgi:hypothetical protein